MKEELLDEITILCDSKDFASANQIAEDGRRWKFRAHFNKHEIELKLKDPWPQHKYHGILKPYIEQCAQAVSRDESQKPDGGADAALALLREEVDAYRDFLLDALELRCGVKLQQRLKPGSKGCKIFIHEVDAVYDVRYASDQPPSPSIHRVHWELLEHASLPEEIRDSDYYFQICRVKSFRNATRRGTIRTFSGIPRVSSSTQYQLLKEAKEPLAKVLNKADKTIKILLVLARRLGPKPDSKPKEIQVMEDGKEVTLDVIEDDLDTDPCLAQLPLMKIQKELWDKPTGHTMHLDIVRPGSLTALVDHIRSRQKQNPPVHFNIIHFDLHGKVGREK